MSEFQGAQEWLTRVRSQVPRLGWQRSLRGLSFRPVRQGNPLNCGGGDGNKRDRNMQHQETD
jgi:hypothetical protein